MELGSMEKNMEFVSFAFRMIYLSPNANYKGKVIYSDGDTVISEYKNGQEHGRATLYGNR